jgi:hypothetical protein
MHFKALRGGSSDSYVRLPEDYSSGEKTSDEFDLFHLFSLIVARAQVLHQLRESKRSSQPVSDTAQYAASRLPSQLNTLMTCEAC